MTTNPTSVLGLPHLTHQEVNVGSQERLFSLLGGGLLAVYSLSRHNPQRVVLGALAGDLIYRGVTGHCVVYNALNISTAEDNSGPQVSIPHEQGIKVEKTIIIHRTAYDLYNYWHNFENLPLIMTHLQSVKVIDSQHSHWVVKAPAGKNVEWDAEIINEVPDERIGWRSLDGAQVPNAGSVVFTELPEGRGTKVEVTLKYNPPAGQLGALVAKIFGEAPDQQLGEDLRRFKQVMETGVITTTKGQPAAR